MTAGGSRGWFCDREARPFMSILQAAITSALTGGTLPWKPVAGRRSGWTILTDGSTVKVERGSAAVLRNDHSTPLERGSLFSACGERRRHGHGGRAVDSR